MFNRIRGFLAPPVFEKDTEKTDAARMTNIVLIALVFVSTGGALLGLFAGAPSYRWIAAGASFSAVAIWIGLLYLLRKGFVRATNLIIVFINFVTLQGILVLAGGLHQPAYFTNILILAIAMLLLSGWEIFGLAVVSGILAIALFLLEKNGIIPVNATPVSDQAPLLAYVYGVLAIGALLQVAVFNRRRVVRRVVESEQQIAAKNTELQSLNQDLESRVAERTREVERRTLEIQIAAQVARDASFAQNLEELLDRSARLLRERFGYYHIGIFLVDEKGEYAILRAAAGEAGKLMLANHYKIKLDDVGIISQVIRTGKARIAFDTGEDAVYFTNPLLPYTHSEMTLPLQTGKRIIGALDVHSDKANAFTQEDVLIINVMADQMAVAIERTRLVQELRQTALQTEKVSQEYTTRAWRSFSQNISGEQGYRYEGVTPEAITTLPPASFEAVKTGEAVLTKLDAKKGGSILAVPIKLRGQIIGALNLRFQGSEVPAETINLVASVADRLAMALENARLVQDAQHLAARERQINLISAQVQQSTDLETVLQNTVRELGNTLGVPRTFIQIGLINPTANKANDQS